MEDVKNNFKRLQHERPKDAKAQSVMNVEVTVDASEQELSKPLKGFGGLAKPIPTFLKPEAQIVLQTLFSAFEKEKVVREGLLSDWVQGFQAGGVPGMCTLVGVDALISAGYVFMQHKTGVRTNLQDPTAGTAYVRYEQRLLDMIIDGDGGGDKLQKELHHKLDNAGLNKDVLNEDTPLE